MTGSAVTGEALTGEALTGEPGTGEPLFAGLDIGGSKVLAVAVDADGVVRAQARVRTGQGSTGVVASAAQALDLLTARLGAAAPGLASVGVGVPGLVDAGGGSLSHAVNLGIGAVPLELAERLGRRFGLPVRLENDVNAAALGAATALGLLDADVALLSVGTGVAAGFVLHGRLRRGAREAAGEIGHVPLDPAGPPCACGQRGCLEALASGAALAAAWPVADGGPAAPALFAAAAAGVPGAVAVRDRFAGHLAAAVRMLILTVDVDVVVLGGGVADLGEPLREAVAAALARTGATVPFLRALELPARVRVVPSGAPVAAVGAALSGAGRGIAPSLGGVA